MVLALLIGIALLFGSLLVFGMSMAVIVRLVARLIQSGYAGLGFWKNVAMMMTVSLVILTAHLVQMALWAVALMVIGEIATFEEAFYCSAQNYTALGYGDIVLSPRWRLLGPMEAINGLLLFGLSTATMFALMSKLITNRLRFQIGALGGAAAHDQPDSTCGRIESN